MLEFILVFGNAFFLLCFYFSRVTEAMPSPAHHERTAVSGKAEPGDDRGIKGLPLRMGLSPGKRRQLVYTGGVTLSQNFSHLNRD
jgi:hypothetical protein